MGGIIGFNNINMNDFKHFTNFTNENEIYLLLKKNKKISFELMNNIFFFNIKSNTDITSYELILKLIADNKISTLDNRKLIELKKKKIFQQMICNVNLFNTL